MRFIRTWISETKKLSFSAILLCIATLASLCPPLSSISSYSGRIGFVLAGAVVPVATIGLFSRRRAVAAFVIRNRLLYIALCLQVLVRLASIPCAGDVISASLAVLRAAIVGLFFGAVLFENHYNIDFRKLMGGCGIAIISVHACFFVVGLIFDGARSSFFEIGDHLSLGSIPRFKGIIGGPFACGFTMAASSGLALMSTSRFRRWVAIAGFLLTIASLSFAGILVSVPLIFAAVSSRPIRIVLSAIVFAVALTILYVHPIAITYSGGEFRRSLHSNYDQNNNGNRFMPIHTLSDEGIKIQFHFTGYYYLAKRSLSCFAEHPITGVGGRNYYVACSTTTMTSLGQWTPGRIAHNEYTGLVAEHGILGLAAAVFLVGVLLTRYRFASDDAWMKGILIAYLLFGFAGEVWYQFVFAAFAALTITPKGTQ